MKKVLKSIFLVCLVSLSLSAVAQDYGVICKKGFQHIPQEEIIEFYKNVLDDTQDLKGASFGQPMLDKKRDAETGEVIIFLRTKAQLASGAVLDMISRVYETADRTFSLNKAGVDELSVTACKSPDAANACAAELTSKGGMCEGGKDCTRISIAVSLNTICK